MGGCYRFPAIDLHFTGVFTNKMATDAIRGAGRPEATYWIELMMDRLADELGMDPLELRRKNFIPKEEFPFETALGIVYDSGDYHGTLDKLLENFDLDAFRARAGEPARAGRPPRRGLLDLRRGVRPGAVARGRPAGRGPPGGVLGVGQRARARPPARRSSTRAPRRTARGSTRASRRSRATSSGIDPQNVDVLHGDTDQGTWGWDTYGSRSLAVGGEAIVRAAAEGAGQGQADLRGAAGGRAGGHRAGRRQVPGARLAGQVDDDGRDLRRGAHPAERAAGRHRAGARGELLLRPGELRVPVRRARVRGRRGRGDRQGRRSCATWPWTTAVRRSTRC